MKKAILIFLVLGLLTVSCKRKEDEKKSTISERVEPSAEVMANITTVPVAEIENQTKNKKEEKIEQCVNWIMEELPFQSEILKDAVKEFVKYRIKKGLTEKACKLNAKKIVEYSGNNEEYAIAVVEKTVSSGWQSFYDLNFNEKKKLEQNNSQSFSFKKDYEEDELTKKLKELGV